jgi:DNA replication protein DnaC
MTYHIRHNCTMCQGTGCVELVPEGYTVAQWFGCPDCIKWNESGGYARANTSSINMMEHGVPRIYSTASFQTTDPRRDPLKLRNLAIGYAKLLCAGFDGQETNSALYWGAPGTGKTTMAACIFREALIEGIGGIWYDHNQLMDDLRPKDGHHSRESDGILDMVKRAPFLVIDDFGKGKMTEWAQQLVFSLINYRYNSQAPTLITTNFPPHKFGEEFGETIASRINSSYRIRPTPQKAAQPDNQRQLCEASHD